MHSHAVNVYRKVDLGSAPKHQIVDRLYERLARDLAEARGAIEARDIAGKAGAIDHAMRIVAELEAALDHAAAPELCASLAALYDFVTQRLVEANARMELTPLDQAARVMGELGAAFRKAHGR
jgi:flagellar protein FliS